TPPKPNWVQVTTQNTITGTMSTNLNSFDQFLGVGYWNDIGTTLKLEQGASPSTLSHKATYTFSLDEGDYYKLSMSNPSILVSTTGTSQSGMYSSHNGKKLSTYDADHDTNSGNCATYYANVSWWYQTCWSGNFWGGGDS